MIERRRPLSLLEEENEWDIAVCDHEKYCDQYHETIEKTIPANANMSYEE
jgi:hypothetical protein